MGVKVTFLREADEKAPTAAQPTTLVPKAAVQTASGSSFVFVIRGDDTVERRAVRTGGTDGDRLEVLGGLRGGERVVVSPPAELKDGAKVIAK